MGIVKGERPGPRWSLFQDIATRSGEGMAAGGLRYFTDSEPGLTRIGKPGKFRYLDPDGKPVRDKAVLARIRKLAIPPAWQDVWIAPGADAHLQATGRDARGRKQYRYHAEFVAMRDEAKFAHLLEFAMGLPALRKRLKADLRRPGLSRDKVLAVVVALLEETLARIGTEDYVRANGSFGLTTLRNRHVQVRGQMMTFRFKGKSGKIWNLSIRDRRIARIVSSCQDLPGQNLFEYLDDDGAILSISSADVNAYLRAASGRDITAKDFRTWAATVRAGIYLSREQGEPSKKRLQQIVAAVADELGNTVAVCRRCYIHPDIIAAYEAGRLKLRIPGRATGGLSASERGVLSFLRGLSAKSRRRSSHA